ncbi:MAG: hypothetical protein H0W16_08450 [Actinobacteria bacterium]|nr:hypothetical protein [Actinomycetota bacterium]
MTEHAADQPVIDAPLATPVVDPIDETPRDERARLSGYRRRFAGVYLALALVAGIGLGAVIVLAGRSDPGPPAVWSQWRPSGSETARIRQIADHVSTRYRFPSGGQLVVALAGPPTVTAGGGDAASNPIPVRTIAVRPDTSTGKAEDDDIAIVDASKSLQFVLCGLGDNCSISQGEASEARHSILRRQALELSLYTFKYVDDVDSVTIFLPPPPGAESPGSAVFLRRGDVRAELSRPLSRTIAPGAPSIGGLPTTELQTLNRITGARLYRYEYTQAQDLSAVLILDPIVL